MLTHVISIYDRKTKQYSNLMTPRSLERVPEEFKEVCKNPQSQFHKYPEDYEVHHLGSFNDSPHHDPEIPNTWFLQPKVIATGEKHANS